MSLPVNLVTSPQTVSPSPVAPFHGQPGFFFPGVIDKTVPLDSGLVHLGDDALRTERVSLRDFFTAYRVRHQEPSVPGDPATTTGAFDIPFAAPAPARVGDLYFATTGLVYCIVAGPVSQLAGTIEKASRMSLRQDAAPVGWTRDASLPTGSVLRFVQGTQSSGGTQDVNTSLAHTPDFTSGNAPDPYTVDAITAHSLKYVDVILATKD